ncbi:hypothetical protein [Amycolatopsis anabasis]|uniref:hypothetical protein n=1 Tax=Amycolatopsis anabasis TaxID=1840409 RepID=UPI00131CC230|nr:hypothetical protein [Amycolatopsis anabasis]
MARTGPRGTDDPRDQVTVADLVSRSGTVPLRREPNSSDTMPFFMNALNAADGPEEAKQEPPPTESGARHRRGELDVLDDVLDDEQPPSSPAEEGRRRRIAVWSACALVPLGIAGGLIYGFSGEEPGTAGAVVPPSSSAPKPVAQPPSTTSQVPDTATLRAEPPPTTTESKTQERQAASKTKPPAPPRTTAEKPRDPMADLLSSIKKDWESRLKDFPRR